MWIISTAITKQTPAQWLKSICLLLRFLALEEGFFAGEYIAIILIAGLKVVAWREWVLVPGGPKITSDTGTLKAPFD